MLKKVNKVKYNIIKLQEVEWYGLINFLEIRYDVWGAMLYRLEDALTGRILSGQQVIGKDLNPPVPEKSAQIDALPKCGFNRGL